MGIVDARSTTLASTALPPMPAATVAAAATATAAPVPMPGKAGAVPLSLQSSYAPSTVPSAVTAHGGPVITPCAADRRARPVAACIVQQRPPIWVWPTMPATATAKVVNWRPLLLEQQLQHSNVAAVQQREHHQTQPW